MGSIFVPAGLTTSTETSKSWSSLNISLNKFDHVSDFYKQLQWLNFSQLIQFHLVCVMFHQYHKSKGTLLQPPIQFGNTSSYHTRTQPHFANLSRRRLSQTKQFFRHTATTTWNNLESSVKLTTSFAKFYRATKDNLLYI